MFAGNDPGVLHDAGSHINHPDDATVYDNAGQTSGYAAPTGPGRGDLPDSITDSFL